MSILAAAQHRFERSIQRSALFSADGKYRYWLKRSWHPNAWLPVTWVMLNPSLASDTKDDPTVKRCIDFSRWWGFDSLVIVNLYAYITPKPAELWAQELQTRQGPDNVGWIRTHTQHPGAIVVAAWGAAAHHKMPIFIPETVRRHLHCIGQTAEGYPKHPLARGKHRVPTQTMMKDYRP